MAYNIVLTTAEDIVAVVDAVVAKGHDVNIDFISEFTGIATEAQVTKALDMAIELKMVVREASGNYSVDSFLAKKLSRDYNKEKTLGGSLWKTKICSRKRKSLP